MDLITLYKDHERLLNERAWEWTKRTGREFGDMLGVCHESFMETVRIFEPSRGAKFSSMLALRCNQDIVKFCQRTDLPIEDEPDITALLPARDDVVQNVAWREFVHALSEEARSIVETIFESVADLLALVQPNDASGKSMQNAVEQLMWRRSHMTRAQLAPLFNEIKLRLEEAR